jgi:hypothetical protein
MTIAGETEELGENLPSATLSHHKSHMPRSGFEPRTAAVILLLTWEYIPHEYMIVLCIEYFSVWSPCDFVRFLCIYCCGIMFVLIFCSPAGSEVWFEWHYSPECMEIMGMFQNVSLVISVQMKMPAKKLYFTTVYSRCNSIFGLLWIFIL